MRPHHALSMGPLHSCNKSDVTLQQHALHMICSVSEVWRSAMKRSLHSEAAAGFCRYTDTAKKNVRA